MQQERAAHIQRSPGSAGDLTISPAEKQSSSHSAPTEAAGSAQLHRLAHSQSSGVLDAAQRPASSGERVSSTMQACSGAVRSDNGLACQDGSSWAVS